MIDVLIKRVSVTYKCYEMYAHRGKNLQPVLNNSLLIAYNFDVMRTELYI